MDEFYGEVGDGFVEELDLVDAYDVDFVDVVEAKRGLRGGVLGWVLLQASWVWSLWLAMDGAVVAEVDVGLEAGDALAGDAGSFEAADELFGFAGEHGAGDDFETAGMGIGHSVYGKRGGRWIFGALFFVDFGYRESAFLRGFAGKWACKRGWFFVVRLW